jgi:hypothetical protein
MSKMKNTTTVFDAIKNGLSYKQYKKRNKVKKIEKKYWQAVKNCIRSEA